MARPIARIVRRYGNSIRWISVAVIVVSVFALIQVFPFGQSFRAVSDWIERLGFWGPLVYGLIYVVATVLLVPGSILTLTAGAVFGLKTGFFTVWIGSTAGATSAFLIGRYLARRKVAELAGRYPKFDAIDRAVGQGGWRIVALLRLSPAVPFNLQNYLYGLTRIRFWPCLFATWLGMIPGSFLFVYVGHIAGATAFRRPERTVLEWGMLVVGLLATVTVTVYITALAKRQLRERTGLETDGLTDEEDEDSSGPDDDAGEQPARKRPFRLLMIAAVAVLFTAAAVYTTDLIR